ASCNGSLAIGAAESSCAAGACDGSGGCLLPLLWYKFDEPSGATSAANSGSWPGTYSSFAGAPGSTGMRGNAILFGSTDTISFTDPANGSLDNFARYTAEGWINMTKLPTNGQNPLVMKYSSYTCSLAY